MGTGTWTLPLDTIRRVLNLPDTVSIPAIHSNYGQVHIWISDPNIPDGTSANAELRPVFEHGQFGSRLVGWDIDN